MARFRELLRCVGVDEAALPDPGMIVPMGGSNFGAIEFAEAYYNKAKPSTVDFSTIPSSAGIVVTRVDALDIRRKMIDLNIELSQPGVDKTWRSTQLMPESLTGDTYFFRVDGKTAVDFGSMVYVEASSGQFKRRMRVVVLNKQEIKVAIRNVQINDISGTVKFHAQKPCNPKDELDSMNAVWGPQSNISFSLVSSQPAMIDMTDKSTRDDVVKALDGVKLVNDEFPGSLYVNKLAVIFQKLMVAGAHITFFVVEEMFDQQGNKPDGTMRKDGMCFITGMHSSTTFAHEAGHFVGGEWGSDGWQNLGHAVDLNDVNMEFRLLMRASGAGMKIPFDAAKKFRGFLDRRAKAP